MKTDGGGGGKCGGAVLEEHLHLSRRNLSSLNLLWLFNLHLSCLLKKVSLRLVIFTEILQRCHNPGAKAFVSDRLIHRVLTFVFSIFSPYFGILQRTTD